MSVSIGNGLVALGAFAFGCETAARAYTKLPQGYGTGYAVLMVGSSLIIGIIMDIAIKRLSIPTNFAISIIVSGYAVSFLNPSITVWQAISIPVAGVLCFVGGVAFARSGTRIKHEKTQTEEPEEARKPKDQALADLGLDETANYDQVKQKYKKLSLKYHPDKNKAEGATERFQKISAAKNVLDALHNQGQFA